jgi:hypothetical protein
LRRAPRRDSYTGEAIQAAIVGAIGQDEVAGARIRDLLILFDEGRERGAGCVHLDTITVNDRVWTSAADNGARMWERSARSDRPALPPLRAANGRSRWSGRFVCG